MATSWKADISGTENFFWIFFTFLKSTVNLKYLERKISPIALVLQKLLTAKQLAN